MIFSLLASIYLTKFLMLFFHYYKGPEHVGTFLDRPIPEQEVPDTSRVKQLAALMSQRSQSTPEGINLNTKPNSSLTVFNL